MNRIAPALSTLVAVGLVACGTVEIRIDDDDASPATDASTDGGDTTPDLPADTTETDAAEIDTSEPDASQTDTSEPDAGGPDVSEPDAGACDAPNPAGCAATGCEDGFSCQPTGAEGCAPSMCSCDVASGTWECTADCGPIVACVADSGACGEDPRGCRATGCPVDTVCEIVDDTACVPSSCICGDDGFWACTDDCGPRYDCVADPSFACPGPDPRTCTQTGCPDGQACMPTGAEGCASSACFCDVATAAWVCTPDCAPMVACRPVEPGDACEEPDPRGCVAIGCEEGFVCAPADTDGCRPSGCTCDGDTGSWICTEDCLQQMTCQAAEAGAGCDAPNPAGCYVDGCPDGLTCAPTDEKGGMRCQPSFCACDAATGAWSCTRDCATVVSCQER